MGGKLSIANLKKKKEKNEREKKKNSEKKHDLHEGFPLL